MRIPAVFPSGFEVLVFSSDGGPTLGAAVELVSPGNKDRHQTRTAFAVKCAAYLQQDRGQFVPLDLEGSYNATCRNTRLL
jgi:hypothetical protein